MLVLYRLVFFIFLAFSLQFGLAHAAVGDEDPALSKKVKDQIMLYLGKGVKEDLVLVNVKVFLLEKAVKKQDIEDKVIAKKDAGDIHLPGLKPKKGVDTPLSRANFSNKDYISSFNDLDKSTIKSEGLDNDVGNFDVQVLLPKFLPESVDVGVKNIITSTLGSETNIGIRRLSYSTDNFLPESDKKRVLSNKNFNKPLRNQARGGNLLNNRLYYSDYNSQTYFSKLNSYNGKAVFDKWKY